MKIVSDLIQRVKYNFNISAKYVEVRKLFGSHLNKEH